MQDTIIKRTIAALTGYKTALSVLGEAKGPVEAWVTSDCDDMGDAEVLENIEAAIKDPPDIDNLIAGLEDERTGAKRTLASLMAISEHYDACEAAVIAEKARADETLSLWDGVRQQYADARVRVTSLERERDRANGTARHIIAVCEGNGGVESLGSSDVEMAIKRMVLRDAEQMRKLERERDEARARVDDLLVSNNTYLENARRSRRDLLREKIKCRALAEKLTDREGETEG